MRGIKSSIQRRARQNFRLRHGLITSLALISITATIPGFGDGNAVAAGQEQLGEVHFPISCKPELQTRFDRAVSLLHWFSFPEAAAAFKSIASDDPNCAMAYWGLAATSIGSLFAGRTGPTQLLDGLSNDEKAEQIGGKTQRERDYIAAVKVFFQNSDKVGYVERERSYADALEALSQRYPDDREAKIFYAYALTSSASPTDQTFAVELKGAAILEQIFNQAPTHPGVLHYLVHAYDHTPIAARGLKYAALCAVVAPSSPHALHIPSHIFVRLGQWQDSIKSNIVGSNVTDLFFKLHAMDFLTYSYLQTGQDVEAKQVLDELNAIGKIAIPHVNVAYALAAIPARYAIEREDWNEAAALTLPRPDYPWIRFPQAEATLVFARALGEARSGRVDAATADAARLQGLQDKFEKMDGDAYKPYWAVQIAANRDMVLAWIAYAKGDHDKALHMLQAAADREDAYEEDPVVPGSIISARQLLGEMQLELKLPDRALQTFEAALKVEPGRFRSLYGAGRAAELVGNRAKARTYYTRLLAQAALANRTDPGLAAAKAFLGEL